MEFKDRFMATSLIVKIVVAILIVTEICNWLAFCTSHWYVHPDYSYHGLWRICITTYCKRRDGTPELFYMAVQAFAIFGFVGVNLSFVFMLIYVFSTKHRNMLCLCQAAISLLFIAVVSWLISVIVFGTQVCNPPEIGRTCNFSYGLAVCTPILALVAAFLLLKDTIHQRTVVNQRSLQAGTTVNINVTTH